MEQRPMYLFTPILDKQYRVMEEREQLMVSPIGDGKPTLRMAHFLNPSLSTNDNLLNTLSPLSLSSETSKTPTDQRNPLNASFKGWRNPQKKWKMWVDHMCSLHKSMWEKAGIYYSIMGSVYSIQKDNDLLIKFAERWCPETRSFLFDFGEVTMTLEDVMTLGGYSVLGDSVLTPLPSGRASDETREELHQARLALVKTRAKKATQGAWMKKFMKSGSIIEHEAFLSLWLSKFVFPSASGHDTIGKKVLPMAILLAQGTRLALAPAVLASIYRDLSLLRAKSEENNASALTVWAPFHLLQAWIWERFPGLGPHPNPLLNGEPRLARWHMAKKRNIENAEFVVATSAKCFLWRPYVMGGTNDTPSLHGEMPRWVSMSPPLPEVLESFGRCVRVSELVGVDCMEEYFPHRVAMQFGMDQDIPRKVVFSPKGNPEIAWLHYSRPISDAKLYIPSRCLNSHVTSRYLGWWKQSDGTKGVVKLESDYDSNPPPGFPPKFVGNMGKNFPSVPPGFPPKCDGKMGKNFPSVPPGFPPKRNIKTEEVCFDFPSIPPGTEVFKKLRVKR